ncbi:MAG: excinuclease ABC subunit UvrC, partial [Holosporales bacterium]|nr:excinuclease ABC subunit UvrC [Holosporales bacterium]
MNAGIYKMIDINQNVIYVGKAKHLKNRLLSYTHIEKLSNKTKMMLSKVIDIEITIVQTEIEALLLESNLIKQLKPFYNILLKDDKTFPYIMIDRSSDFPRIFKYRTIKASGPNFFGPYPIITSLDETLKVIQKAFLLRSCTEYCFSSRKRPCLQYFIKRCSGACVGKISKEEYAKNVTLAENLLLGKDETARQMLIHEMNDAAKALKFERAAFIRNRIKALSEIQSRQYIQIMNLNSIDFIAVAKDSETAVVVVSFFRIGKNVGSEKFFIQNLSAEDEFSDILESFITQFYKNLNPPTVIVTSYDMRNKKLVSEFLKGAKILFGKTGEYSKIIDSCLTNAKMYLNKKNPITELQELLGIKKINRIEAYDNSHIHGTNACGVMIVFENDKLQKDKARRFNIEDRIANNGDDISMMQFVLEK